MNQPTPQARRQNTHVFVASTTFGLATIAAGIADGAWPGVDQRILVISNNSTTPEATPGLLASTGVDELLGLFDRVYDYNELIAPLHPSEWRPPDGELPLLQRLVRLQWGLGEDDLRLIVESIQAAPALTIARLLPDAPIDVYADGLMSYGPTRVGLYTQIGSRVDRVLHLDLVPGVTPLLLREWETTPMIIGTDSFRQVIGGLGIEVPKVITAAPDGSVAVLLGQYLSAVGILSLDEEQELLRQLVVGAVAAGFTTLVFKPHPSAPDVLTTPLIMEAERVGADLTVHDEPDLVEGWFDQPGIGLVAGCFSTALLTAATCYGLPTARVGTTLSLERVRPYENSNRIPVTLVHATLPALPRPAAPDADLLGAPQSGSTVITDAAAPAPVITADLVAEPDVTPATSTGEPIPLDELVRMVGYCMQPGRNPDLRPTAERLLAEEWEAVRGYVKRRRLTILDLPGRLPSLPSKKKQSKRPRSKLRRTVRKILGPRVSRVVGRGRRSLIRLVKPATGRLTGSVPPKS